ncbi:hypothetical protein C2E23DRAFT_459091 [Lenzites betulinus]|nr:hypothetical protein C2E23DRAFT_458987 [Lenzites betulinus]KAH9856823.1 hypothetical protein C2E23DRAFT_459053 [Lenzites betulinus]KAH9856826.1 hypothetical protein C2E23DRAFT_459091 [Lenzites betulinus]
MPVPGRIYPASFGPVHEDLICADFRHFMDTNTTSCAGSRIRACARWCFVRLVVRTCRTRLPSFSANDASLKTNDFARFRGSVQKPADRASASHPLGSQRERKRAARSLRGLMPRACTKRSAPSAAPSPAPLRTPALAPAPLLRTHAATLSWKDGACPVMHTVTRRDRSRCAVIRTTPDSQGRRSTVIACPRGTFVWTVAGAHGMGLPSFSTNARTEQVPQSAFSRIFRVGGASRESPAASRLHAHLLRHWSRTELRRLAANSAPAGINAPALDERPGVPAPRRFARTLPFVDGVFPAMGQARRAHSCRGGIPRTQLRTQRRGRISRATAATLGQYTRGRGRGRRQLCIFARHPCEDTGKCCVRTRARTCRRTASCPLVWRIQGGNRKSAAPLVSDSCTFRFRCCQTTAVDSMSMTKRRNRTPFGRCMQRARSGS